MNRLSRFFAEAPDRLRYAVASALLVMAVPAFACGPEFPPDLLSDRHASLFDLIDGTFDFEASRLAPKPATVFTPNENSWAAPGEARTEIEKKELGEKGYERAEAVRAAADDASAFAAGEGLSDEVRLYLAGARAFHAGETDVARARFDAVLALPADQQRTRGIWARYMLGRMNLSTVDGGPEIDEATADAAAKDFQAVRAAVAAGAPDPLGLAVASYGEEAAIHRKRGDTAAAVKLYAEQAAQGSASGRASLLFTARDLFADEEKLATALKDPLLQQLLASYVYTRTGELEGYENGEPVPSERLQSYYAAVEAADAKTLAGVDRVAAAAYRTGRYELAAKLAPRSDSALAHWVRAKLALRAGDDKAAVEAYAQAARAFPRDEDWGSNPNEGYFYDGFKPACRVDGERGILALARGDYIEALTLFHASGEQSWVDEAHVAERVLSVDELKQFVDTRVPAPPPLPAQAPSEGGDSRIPLAVQLRTLLGRRLLRAGRYDDAVAYFPADLRDTAAAYAKARTDAPKQGRIEQAETLFRAAKLARESGMEILGFELAPDAATYGGMYEIGEFAPESQDRKFVGADEARRFGESAPQPAQRFHYRYVAAELADQAAGLVPARSQAFAAMLCSATGWLVNRDVTAARRYYDRYVAEGPYVAWAGNFGHDCPAPDFSGAARRLQFERIRWAKQTLRRAAPFVAAGLVVLVAGVVIWRRRRTKPIR
ncbi:MAG TPA: hypothetical protein VLF18_02750 [Tahibacter sp.]|uniref:hypothetical protein n=1 Tax=Tahibacter sp. TaxID=2056211 RepID=UPI002D061E70|nr:hypothetical protein [Tahibacter sp.]HSX59097.1 hypothetical protein [Tahibacter sp.]